ncbi:hypothetical protein [Psychrobacter sp. GP33]|uniref:hypothetical protein n=1 Tax=Psychrobacter sp. GP33 TaxID=2758709 RepID=UPI0015F910ED|nr:hypothetical protein [Psychrobacter sp. GP33]
MNGQVTRLSGNQDFTPNQASISYRHSQLSKLVTDEYISDVRRGKRNVDDFYSDLYSLKAEEARSLLYIENFLINKSWENIDFDNDDYRNLLILRLKEYRFPIDRYNELIHWKIQNFLPESYLSWFNNDLRCSLFLASLVENLLTSSAYKGRAELIAEIEALLRLYIHMFNTSYYNNLPQYQTGLQQHSGDWKTVCLLNVKSIYLKNRTESKDLKWIDASNSEQLEWIYSYLDKNKYIALKGVFFPETDEEKYDLICTSLDRLSNVESNDIGTKNKKGFSLRSYTLFSMKKAWDGQKQYAIKKPSDDDFSVKIYKKNRNKLEMLAARSDLTVNKLLNKLLEDEYDRVDEVRCQTTIVSTDRYLEESVNMLVPIEQEEIVEVESNKKTSLRKQREAIMGYKKSSPIF